MLKVTEWLACLVYPILRISSSDLEKFEQIFQLERYETKDTAVKKRKWRFLRFFDALCVYLKCLFYEVFEKVYEGKVAGDFLKRVRGKFDGF